MAYLSHIKFYIHFLLIISLQCFLLAYLIFPVSSKSGTDISTYISTIRRAALSTVSGVTYLPFSSSSDNRPSSLTAALNKNMYIKPLSNCIQATKYLPISGHLTQLSKIMPATVYLVGATGIFKQKLTLIGCHGIIIVEPSTCTINISLLNTYLYIYRREKPCQRVLHSCSTGLLG